MARLFVSSSSQFLRNTNAVLTAYPVTLAGWFYPTSNTTNMAIVAICERTEVTAGAVVALSAVGAVGGDPVRAQPNGVTGAETTTGFSLNTWHHACGVFASSSSQAAYIDGGSKGTATDSHTWITPGDTYIGGLAFNNNEANLFDGRIAEVGIWNVALTDAEVAILGKGYSPLLVRPQSLVFYAPLASGQSPELDIVGGYDMTLNNAPTIADHPPVFHDANTGLVLPDVNDYPISLLRLAPQQAVPPSSSYASLALRNRHPVIAFSSGSQEDIVFDFVMPKTYSGNGLALVLHSSLASATSGYVRAGISLERIGDGQQDVDSDGFADSNYQSFPVPALTGWVERSRVRFSDGADMDSIAAGEKCRLRVRRYSDDTASGDWQLHMVDIRGK